MNESSGPKTAGQKLAAFFARKGFAFFSLPEDRPSVTVEEMKRIAKTFAERLFSHPEMSKRLRESGIIFRFVYFDDRWGDEEPEITVRCLPDEIEFFMGPCDVPPMIEMRMHADTAHRFWRKKLNLMGAVSRGMIKVRGPLHKAMRLLPFARFGFEIYEEMLKEMGREDLLAYP